MSTELLETCRGFS